MRVLSVLILMPLLASAINICPLSGITPYVYLQEQKYGESTGTYNWYFSPCGPSTPEGQASCIDKGSNSGYFAEYDTPGVNNGECHFFMNSIAAGEWTHFDSAGLTGYQADFSGPSGNTAGIVVLCDATVDNFVPDGQAIATEISTGFHWQVTLKSKAACGGSSTPTTPAPTPLPPGHTAVPPTPTNASNSGSGSGGTDAPTLVNCTVDGVKHVNVPVADCYPAPPPKKEEGGCGGGCVFLIVFFVGGFLYVVGAVAWNFKGGKRGKELAPHPEFWGEVPGLIKDGAIFFAAGVCALVDKCRGKGGSKGEGGYSSV